MNDPNLERLDALTEAILRVRRRQDDLERRVAAVEEMLGGRTTAPAPGPVADESLAAPPPLPEPAAMPAVEPPPPIPEFTPATPAPPPREVFETQVGLGWVNRIGAVTLVLAAAFFFKYAVDNQWIGETGRVLIGVLAGFAGIIAGDRLWKRGHQNYAQGVSGAGASILYLSFYAAFGLYHLVAAGLAFALLMAATAMAGALALRYNAPALAALGMIGGYLTPVLLSTGEYRPWAFYGYLLVINAGWMAVARARGWQALEWLALAATSLLGISFASDRLKREDAALVGPFAALAHYAVFAVSPVRLIYLLAQTLAALALAASWEDELPGYAVTSLAVAVAGLAVADRRKWPDGAGVSFAAFAGAFWAWRVNWSGDLPLGGMLLYVTAGFALFFAWTPFRLLVRREAVGPQELLLLAGNATAYFAAGFDLLSHGSEAWRGLFAVAVAGVHLWLGRSLMAELPEERRDTRPVLLAGGIALSLLTLAVPIQFSGYRITMAWALEGAALAWIARRTESRYAAAAALAVWVMVVMRLLSIDAWMYRDAAAYALLANWRFATFGLSAAAMALGAWWIAPRQLAAAPYVAAHFVLLWGLGLEVGGWAWRTSLAENARSVETAGISILMAAYALALVGAGAATRTVLNRMLGLGLLALVVLKLYLFDVWSMVRIYRVVAFGALGGLLLAVSYVYSRYREKIEALWRDEAKSGD